MSAPIADQFSMPIGSMTTPQLGCVLELALRLAEDQRQRARLLVQLLKRVPVVVKRRIAVLAKYGRLGRRH